VAGHSDDHRQTEAFVRLRLLVAGVAALVAATATATPAFADTVGTTNITLSVSAGGLAITVPATTPLGSGAPGATVIDPLGVVQVNDLRALLNTAWTTSVSATNLTTGTGTPAETIATTFISYWSGGGIAETGTGTFIPGQPTSSQAQNLSTPRTAFSLVGGTGNNSASWNPTLEVDIPVGAVFGNYRGTVTHSVG
jgi:hypothetical protein